MTTPLPHLDTFALAAELGSFTAAARRLGVSQALVSQRIAELEGELKISLFARQSGRAKLTDAGHTLHEHARQILALHDRARQELTGRAVVVTGEVSLAASSVPGECILPDLLPRLQARHPHLHLKARIVDSREVFRLVEHGDVDLGLAGDRTDNVELVQQKFAHDEMVLIVPPGHPWIDRDCVSIQEVQTQSLIVRETGSGSRHCLEQALGRAGNSLADFRVALELGSNESITSAVRRGLGVAFLSSVAVQVQVEPLHYIRVNNLDLDRDFYAVHDRRRALPIPARLFLDLLLQGAE